MSIPTAKQKSVVVFGEVMMDFFPERTLIGGAPFNVACHLQPFRLTPLFISRTGNDAYRQLIMEAMRSKGMATHGVQTDIKHPTGQVTVHVADRRHTFEILDQQAYDLIAADAACIASQSAAPTLVYFGRWRNAMQLLARHWRICWPPALRRALWI